MGAYFAGFICAIVLAILIIIWIAYCMFCKEKHKSEVYQYDISALQDKLFNLPKEAEKQEKESKLTAGIIILPSRRKNKDDYYKRPDYPESPVHNFQPGIDGLVNAFNADVIDVVECEDKTGDIECSSQYQSDV